METTRRTMEKNSLGVALRDKVKATEIRKTYGNPCATHRSKDIMETDWHVSTYTDERGTLAVT